MESTPEDEWLFVDIASATLARLGADDWTLVPSGVWCPSRAGRSTSPRRRCRRPSCSRGPSRSSSPRAARSSSAAPVLSGEGSFESMLTAPDGSRVRDERPAHFDPPAWAVPPVPVPAPVAAASGVLVADRFAVTAVVRHSYGGGVFVATDRTTGSDVILKQARPYAMATLQGTDARDNLRHEAAILDLLAPLGLAPRAVALVTHGRSARARRRPGHCTGAAARRASPRSSPSARGRRCSCSRVLTSPRDRRARCAGRHRESGGGAPRRATTSGGRRRGGAAGSRRRR